MNYLPKQRLFLPFFCLISSFAILSGCSPVIWTPTWSHDSKSFFYTQDDGTVLQYDLTSKSTQALIKLGGDKPCRVAISPDNRLVAVAAVKATRTKETFFDEAPSLNIPKGHTIEVTLVQLSDKKVLKTKTQKWGDSKAAQEPQMTAAYWCPSGKRILICYDNSCSDGLGFAVYDVESEELTEMDAPMPETLMMSFLGVSPLVPDGSGYLALAPQEEKEEKKEGEKTIIRFVFVDWEGKQQVIKNTPEMKAFWMSFAAKGAERVKGFSTAKWDQNVLTIFSNKGRICIDPKKQTTSIEPLSKKQHVLFEAIPESRTEEIVTPFPHSSLQVRLYSTKKENGSMEKKLNSSIHKKIAIGSFLLKTPFRALFLLTENICLCP